MSLGVGLTWPPGTFPSPTQRQANPGICYTLLRSIPGSLRSWQSIGPAPESSSRAARKDGVLFPTPMKVGQNHTTLIQFEAGNNPPLNNMRRILTNSDPKS